MFSRSTNFIGTFLCDFIGGCSQCAFIGWEQVEMEIHDAKIHSEKFQCAIGDFEGKHLDNIEPFHIWVLLRQGFKNKKNKISGIFH